MGKRYGQLTMEERVEIYRLHADGRSQRAIGACLGRSPATISRELGRNSLPTKVWEGGYEAVRAQALTDRRRQRGRPHKLTASPELRATLPPHRLDACVQRYNNTPRKCLRFLTPNEAFAYAASTVALQT